MPGCIRHKGIIKDRAKKKLIVFS
uniref:Uncharacterized protein n=1 Tax=Anguilla anguilla TaxID=7936 RepID=A0A0E9VZ05_ANGAN